MCVACLEHHGRVKESSACHICCCVIGLSRFGLAHLHCIAESCLEMPVDNVRPWSFLYYFLDHKNNHCFWFSYSFVYACMVYCSTLQFRKQNCLYSILIILFHSSIWCSVLTPPRWHNSPHWAKSSSLLRIRDHTRTNHTR
jgi:hypothetical protein